MRDWQYGCLVTTVGSNTPHSLYPSLNSSKQTTILTHVKGFSGFLRSVWWQTRPAVVGFSHGATEQ